MKQRGERSSLRSYRLVPAPPKTTDQLTSDQTSPSSLFFSPFGAPGWDTAERLFYMFLIFVFYFSFFT